MRSIRASRGDAPAVRQSGPPGEPRAIGWLYVLPAFAVYGAFALYPLIRAVWLSLYDWDGLTVGTWVGLDNYVHVLGDERLRASFGHALVLMIFFAGLPLVIGLALAPQLPSRGDRTRWADARLARRLHLRPAGGRRRRDVVRDRTGDSAAPRRDEPDPQGAV